LRCGPRRVTLRSDSGTGIAGAVFGRVGVLEIAALVILLAPGPVKALAFARLLGVG